MADFLLELCSEEIPARMQEKACADLDRLFTAALTDAGVRAESIATYATPRRLALIARGLPAETAAVSEERRGPRTDAPDKAVEGFLRGAGLTRDQLEAREEKKGSFWYARIETPGRAMADILAAAIPDIVRSFPWPKSMRWGAASTDAEPLRWVRPLQGIIALLNGEVVPFEIGGIASGRTTCGHRFMASGNLEIADADEYADRLAAAHVILSADERQNAIFAGATEAADEAGLTLIEDDALLAENAGLTEWPVPLLGRFDKDFLNVPPEVIRLAMKTHQKYFALNDKQGKLANAFICTANIDAAHGGRRIVTGNEKVLAARLADARFFWEQDRKIRLEDRAEKLKDIVFHEKLGTVADKVERVAKLARWLVEEGIVAPSAPPVIPAHAGIQSPSGRKDTNTDSTELDSRVRGNDEKGKDITRLADQAERAARLCKADLVTGMVYEFPELQGVMGGHYARAQGEDDAVADAIRDHYKPVGQGDEVPTAPVTVAVSLADKLDTLALHTNFEFSGSSDKFGVRRNALSIVNLLAENSLRIELAAAIKIALRIFSKVAVDKARIQDPRIKNEIGSGEISAWDYAAEYENWDIEASAKQTFGSAVGAESDAAYVAEEAGKLVLDRVKIRLKAKNIRHDYSDAIASKEANGDIVRLLARVKALQAFMETDEGAALLAGYKRAANILKKENWTAAEENEIPETGEEDPLVLVDDPAMKPVVAAMVKEAYTPEPAEAALIAALDEAEPKARTAVAEERFEDAMAALAALRAPIDEFFDNVTVNDADGDKRKARLALLARIRAAVHNVADFSQIEG